MSRQKGSPKTGGRQKGQKNKRTIEQEKTLEYLRQEIRKEWQPLIKTKIELAKGIWVEKIIGKESVKVYQEIPDSNSLEYLFSMVVGKPKEHLDIDFKVKELKGIQDGVQSLVEMAVKRNKKNKL